MASHTTNVDESIKHITTHVEDKLGGDSLDDAKNASDAEHSATFWQAISANRKAVLWSAVISMSIVMEGYDTILMGNFFGYPSFQKKYSSYHPGSGYQVSGPLASRAPERQQRRHRVRHRIQRLGRRALRVPPRE